eukprot:7380293-Prymnesium_polylepis.1
MDWRATRAARTRLTDEVGARRSLGAYKRPPECLIAQRRVGDVLMLPTSSPSVSLTVRLLALIASRRLTLITVAGLLSESAFR